MVLLQNDLLIINTEVVDGLDGREILLWLAGLIPPEQSRPTLDDDLGQGLDTRILTDLVALIPSAVDEDNFVWNKILSQDDEFELRTVWE